MYIYILNIILHVNVSDVQFSIALSLHTYTIHLNQLSG